MLSAEHRRPLAAFLLVGVLAVLILGNGLRTDVITRVVRGGAPSTVVTALAPDLVLGGSLADKPATTASQPAPAAAGGVLQVALDRVAPSSTTTSASTTGSATSTTSSSQAAAGVETSGGSASSGSSGGQSANGGSGNSNGGGNGAGSGPAAPATPVPGADPARAGVVEVVDQGAKAVGRTTRAAGTALGRPGHAVTKTLEAVGSGQVKIPGTRHSTTVRTSHGRGTHGPKAATALVPSRSSTPRAAQTTLATVTGPVRATVSSVAPARPRRASTAAPEPRRPSHAHPARPARAQHHASHGHRKPVHAHGGRGHRR